MLLVLKLSAKLLGDQTNLEAFVNYSNDGHFGKRLVDRLCLHLLLWLVRSTFGRPLPFRTLCDLFDNGAYSSRLLSLYANSRLSRLKVDQIFFCPSCDLGLVRGGFLRCPPSSFMPSSCSSPVFVVAFPLREVNWTRAFLRLPAGL